MAEPLPSRGVGAAQVVTAVVAALTGACLFAPWVKASIAGVDYGGLAFHAVNSTATAFADGLVPAWPILALVGAVAVVGAAVLPNVPHRPRWVAASALALAAFVAAAYFADESRITRSTTAAGIEFTAAFRTGFAWGFYVTAILAGVTLALALVELAGD